MNDIRGDVCVCVRSTSSARAIMGVRSGSTQTPIIGGGVAAARSSITRVIWVLKSSKKGKRRKAVRGVRHLSKNIKPSGGFISAPSSLADCLRSVLQLNGSRFKDRVRGDKKQTYTKHCLYNTVRNKTLEVVQS